MKESGDRPAREPESATFETARVGGRRARPPIFIVGFLAVLVGLIAISVGGRGSVGATPPPVAFASPPASRGVAPTAAPTDSPSPTSIIIRADQFPVVTSPPGAIELLARRQIGALFVHGDVFVARVTWVSVSLLDDVGNVAGFASVSVPGAAGPAHSDGPTLRFDVELPVPDTFAGRLWLDANAYDADGRLVGTVRLEIPTGVRPRIEFEP